MGVRAGRWWRAPSPRRAGPGLGVPDVAAHRLTSAPPVVPDHVAAARTWLLRRPPRCLPCRSGAGSDVGWQG
ncbi:MAG: hypothetical protein AVDCRST_MAG57-85 [uncultured Blastococcus sp.]|uniref:Uncharacterized protein n=1 Tax=uncultured Blastococcus sp. TaxID=217144 RepID=A0A6J4H549_9ACTN|nr:MAG: hypothetical protein AVDCRST_MAG57-85 [uncultured Blastococcus sp.]